MTTLTLEQLEARLNIITELKNTEYSKNFPDVDILHRLSTEAYAIEDKLRESGYYSDKNWLERIHCVYASIRIRLVPEY